jgi:hypothetical protein
LNRLILLKQHGLRPVELGLGILFHPLEGSRELRNYRSMITAAILILLVLIVRVTSIYITSFHITTLQPRDANMVLEVMRVILPLLSWSIACYLITAIMDGEAFFSDVLLAMSYSMIPYIVFSVPIALLSIVVTRDEILLYHGLSAVMWIWIAILMLIQIQVLNDYSFKKTIGVTIISLFAFIIFWATIGLTFALTNHVIQFMKDVVIEVMYLLAN